MGIRHAGLLAALLSSLALSIGTLGRAVEGDAPRNPKCPVLTDKDTDPKIFAEYMGKRVYFCCPMCRTAFAKDAKPHLANLPAGYLAGASPSGPGAAGAEHAHEHAPRKAEPAAKPGIGSRLVAFLGKFHPAVVHFPIALIVAAALAELLFLVTHRVSFANASRYTIVLGAAGALVAMGLGFAAAESASFTGEYAEILEWHESSGVITAVGSAIAAIAREVFEWRQWQKARWVYVALLFGCAAVVSVTGYLGGSLVYGPDHYMWQ